MQSATLTILAQLSRFYGRAPLALLALTLGLAGAAGTAAHRPPSAASPDGDGAGCPAVAALRHDAGRGAAGDAPSGRPVDRRSRRADGPAGTDRRRARRIVTRAPWPEPGAPAAGPPDRSPPEAAG